MEGSAGNASPGRRDWRRCGLGLGKAAGVVPAFLFRRYQVSAYAMALRVEKRWVQVFSGIAMQPPQWYQGASGTSFEPSLFVNDLGVMSSHAADVMSSAPRSSSGSSSDSSSSGGTSGSGFSDSGSSGGGFGGGGGGGF
jgi:uncharacterized membrane protein YgcG